MHDTIVIDFPPDATVQQLEDYLFQKGLLYNYDVAYSLAKKRLIRLRNPYSRYRAERIWAVDYYLRSRNKGNNRGYMSGVRQVCLSELKHVKKEFKGIFPCTKKH